MTAPSSAPRRTGGQVVVTPDELAAFFKRLEAAVVDEKGVPRLLTPLDVASLFGVERRTVVDWANKGLLAGYRGERRFGWRFTVGGVEEFARRRYVVAVN